MTILNATATGIGCSLAIDAPTEVDWALRPPARRGATVQDAQEHGGGKLQVETESDARLVQAMWRMTGAPDSRIGVRCPFPPSRGLKTSSSTAGALALAARHLGLSPADPVGLAVEASRAAGVTLTGALDDQVAALRGGCHLTDNRRGLVLERLEVQPWHVAVWVPGHAIPKAAVAALDTAPLRDACGEAERLARAGRIPEAMTANGRGFTALYAAAGLPVTAEAAEAALAHGALGAGLSGTGPAVAALFERRVGLPPVPGGRWSWHRVVA